MEIKEIEKMSRLEENHWWFQGKLLVVKSIMDIYAPASGRYLDIGCGTGMFLRHAGSRHQAYGADISESALYYSAMKGNNLLVRATACQLPFKDASFSMITLLDIIEHMDDDTGMLREAFRLCAPGAYVIITVPAFNMLWGSHDLVHHHLRRYRNKRLRTIATNAGFTVERLTYTNFFIFIPAFLRRIFSRIIRSENSDVRETPFILNAILKFIYRIEAAYLKQWDIPVGVSLLAVLKKETPASS